MVAPPFIATTHKPAVLVLFARRAYAFLGQALSSEKGEKMTRPGISLAFFPAVEERDTWILTVYSDQWEDGMAIRTEVISHTVLDVKSDEIAGQGDMSLALYVIELASQLLALGAPPEIVGRIREDVAWARDHMQTLTPEEVVPE
jgi:hypothetical protein